MTEDLSKGPVAGVARRDVLGYAVAGIVAVTVVRPAGATPESMEQAIRETVGKGKLNRGRVHLELAPLSENGNTVPCAVTVDSPMTAADHVRAIHLFNEKNPQPNVLTVRLGPRAGRAAVTTRIRLSETQDVVAVAEMSDGSFWSDQATVIVTLGACLEDSV
jgi:sulfur-oxidizing protein SoxY